MKKIILATVAFSMIATPAAFAQPYGGPAPKYQQHYGKHHARPVPKKVEKHRRWKRGDRFDRYQARYAVPRHEYRRYRLKEPPRGYRWVRHNNDFILVAAATGIIASIIAATR